MNAELKSLRESVLAKIKNEHVTMRSRAYFWIKIAALVTVALLVLVVSVAICNFILFAIQASGSDQLLGFGSRGFALFIRFFPWWLLILDIGLIVLLEYLLRRFRFGYKSPVLYLLFGLLIVTISIGYTIERVTTVNAYLRDRAHEKRLPGPFNEFFARSGRPPGDHAGMCRCTVRSVIGNTIIADDVDFATTTRITIVVPDAESNATTSGIKVGDVIFVAGERRGDTITAFGIKTQPPGFKAQESGPRDDWRQRERFQIPPSEK